MGCLKPDVCKKMSTNSQPILVLFLDESDAIDGIYGMLLFFCAILLHYVGVCMIFLCLKLFPGVDCGVSA